MLPTESRNHEDHISPALVVSGSKILVSQNYLK
jgi:hypothetical protein